MELGYNKRKMESKWLKFFEENDGRESDFQRHDLCLKYNTPLQTNTSQEKFK